LIVAAAAATIMVSDLVMDRFSFEKEKQEAGKLFLAWSARFQSLNLH
jgi:hypothetical protein